jgi:hypothetical protein
MGALKLPGEHLDHLLQRSYADRKDRGRRANLAAIVPAVRRAGEAVEATPASESAARGIFRESGARWADRGWPGHAGYATVTAPLVEMPCLLPVRHRRTVIIVTH